MKDVRVVAVALLGVAAGCSSSHAVDVPVVMEHGNCQAAPKGIARVSLAEVAKLRGTHMIGLEEPAQSTSASPPLIAISAGERPTAGYRLAVAGPGSIEQGVLILRITESTPPADSMQAQIVTNPCIVVELPAGDYARVRVLDQNGTTLGEIER
jgi:hypothetical protein